MSKLDKKKFPLISHNFRNSLLYVLDSTAQENMMFCMESLSEFLNTWHELYLGETLFKDGIFSKEEVEVLDKFDKTVRSLYPKGQDFDTVDINLLKNDLKWIKVIEEAKIANNYLKARINMENTDKYHVLIGQESADFLKIQVLGYEFPEELRESWDANWLRAGCGIKAGVFKGKFNTQFQTIDFADLNKALKEIFKNLKGKLEFKPLEKSLEFALAGDGLGHFSVIGKSIDLFSGHRGNVLKFEFMIDQTQISGMIKQLNLIEEKFPVKK